MNSLLHRRSFLRVAAIGSVVLAPGVTRASGLEIKGGGSSGVGTPMREYISKMPASLGFTASYTASSSGDGRNRVLAGDLDFAMSEEPMDTDKLGAKGFMQFPLVESGICCVVNIPGVPDNKLRLTATLLGAIYTGKIRKWNDPAIVAENAGLALPDMDIRVLSRGTPNGPPSGTTYKFSQYLLLNNADWRERHGEKITKRWAVGSMVAETSQMVENMKVLEGSIGYLTIDYAIRTQLAKVLLLNKAGKFVAPSTESIKAAAVQADWAKAKDLDPVMMDLPGDATWPIVAPVYAILPREPKDAARGRANRAFFKHLLTTGLDAGPQNPVPIPKIARDGALALLAQATG